MHPQIRAKQPEERNRLKIPDQPVVAQYNMTSSTQAGVYQQTSNQPHLNYYHQQFHDRPQERTLFEDSPETSVTSLYHQTPTALQHPYQARVETSSLVMGSPLIKPLGSQVAGQRHNSSRDTHNTSGYRQPLPRAPSDSHYHQQPEQNVNHHHQVFSFSHQPLPQSTVIARPASQGQPTLNQQTSSSSRASASLRGVERIEKAAKLGAPIGAQSPYDIRYVAKPHQTIESESHQRSIESGTHYGRKPDTKADLVDGEVPGTDVEMIIMNLYSKMKSLEGKYIDLANFYKQELLVKSGKKEEIKSSLTSPRSAPLSDQVQENEKSGQLSAREALNQLQREEPEGQQTYAMAWEGKIINELIEEKKKLQDDIEQVMSLRGVSIGGSSPPPQALSDFKSQIPSKEQLQFLNQQLYEALSEIVDQVEHAQKRATSYIAGKQNDMYQIATNRAYNFPSQLKNEAIGLWYDAKTKVSALLTDLKSLVSQKKTQIEGNLVSSKINSVRGTFLDNLEAVAQGTQKIDFYHSNEATLHPQEDAGQFSKILEENLKREMQQFRKRHEQHQKAIQKMRSSFRFKENLIKEEQQKLQALIKELSRQQSLSLNPGLSHVEDSRRSNMPDRFASIERPINTSLQQSNGMSPFEKKIATYQKSAERRKAGERSGSRSRPVQQPTTSGSNFYQQYPAGHSGAGSQALVDQAHPDEELRHLRNKLKHLENCFEDYLGKVLVRSQDSKDMDRQIDILLTDISKFNTALETVHHQSSQNTQARNDQRTRSKPRQDLAHSYSKSGRAEQSLNASPGFAGANSGPSIQELLKTNEAIQQDLRKATEKYLNQRVENTKLRDEIQILQSQLDVAHSRKAQMSSLPPQSPHDPKVPGQRQQIRLKSRASKNDVMNVSQTSTQPGQTAQRTLSNSSSHIMRENDDLKKRVKDLEKECFQLTYYHQERGRGSSDPLARTNQEMRTKLEQLCLQVQQFMLAMRRLQRAVNNKDKDIQDLKADFEKNKKHLEQMVKDIRDKEEAAKKANTLQNTSQQQQFHNSSLASASPIAHNSMIVGSSIEKLSQRSNDRRTLDFDPSDSAAKPQSVTQRTEVLKNPLTQSISVLEAKIAELNQELAKAHEQTRSAESRSLHVEAVLRKQVVELIAQKEQELDTSLMNLSTKLNEKEEDLKALKKLFVDKLRELESSFVEIDQNLTETEVVTQEAAKKAGQMKAMEQSLEHVIGKIDDDQDEQLDQLVALNEQLADENRELREQVKELAKELESNQDIKQIREQYLELQEEAQSKERAQVQQEAQFLKLKADYNNLIGQLEDQQQKIDFLNSAVHTVFTPQDQKDELHRIEKEPQEAALGYLKALRQQEKEFKILKSGYEQLQYSYDELKGRNDELKIEARESAQELLALESELNELRRGRDVSVHDQLEEDYRQRLAFKDTEIESINLKLSRISQTNIELKTKSDRLEATNFELASENEQARQKLCSLEMELEMTRVNSERESEHLMNQVRQLETQLQQDKNKLNDEIESLWTKNASLQALNEKIVNETSSRTEMLIAEKNGLVEQSNILQVDKNALLDKVQSLEEQIEGFKVDRLALHGQRENQDAEKVALEEVLSSQKALVQELQLSNEELKTQVLSLNKQKDDLEDHYEQELSGLREQAQIAQLQDQSARNDLEQQIEALTEQDRLRQQEYKEQIKILEAQGKALEEGYNIELMQKDHSISQHLRQCQLALALQVHLLKIKESSFDDITAANSIKHEHQLSELRLELQTEHSQAVEGLKTQFNKQLEGLANTYQSQRQSESHDHEQAVAKLQAQISSQQEVISQLKQEQEDLVKTLTEKQDQQTQEMLLLKDSEIKKTQGLLAKAIEDKNSELDRLQADFDTQIQTIKEQHDSEVESLIIQHTADIQKQVDLTKEDLKQVHNKNLEACRALLKEDYETRLQQIVTQSEQLTLKHQADIQTLQEAHAEAVSLQENEKQVLKEAMEKQCRDYEEQIANLKEASRVQLEDLKVQCDRKTLQDLENLKSVLTQESQSLRDQLELAINQHSEEIERYETQAADFEGHMKKQKMLYEELEGELSIERSEKGDLTSQIAELEEKVEQFSERVTELQEENESLRRTLEESENEQVRVLTSRIDQLETERNQAVSQFGKTNSQLEIKVKEVEDQGKDLEQAYLDIEQRQKQQEELEALVSDIQGQVTTKDAECADLKIMIQELKEQSDDQAKETQAYYQAQLAELQIQAGLERQRLLEQVESFEQKIEEVTKEFIESKRVASMYSEVKKLLDVLMVPNDFEKALDLGSEEVQFLKRVSYLDTVWILVSKGSNFAWVSQDRIPKDKLHDLPSLERDQSLLQNKLEEIYQAKDALLKQQQQQLMSSTPRSQSQYSDQQISEYLQVKNLEMENASLKQEVQDLKLSNNTLQQIVMQSKQKSSEMQEFVLGFASTSDQGNLSTVVQSNQELRKQCNDLAVKLGNMQLENDRLAAKLADLTDLSFAKGNIGSVTAGPKSAGNFDGASSIDRDSEDGDQISYLQHRVTTLEDEVSTYRKAIEEQKKQTKALEKSSVQNENEEDQKHFKVVMIQFLKQVPINQKGEDEQLLPIICSFFKITPAESQEIRAARLAATGIKVKDAAKKGVLGMFKK